MIKILVYIVLAIIGPTQSNKAKLTEIKKEAIVDKLISSSINEASELFDISKKDIKSFISIESSFQPWVKGTSGEFGLMQILPNEFESFGPEINDILASNNRSEIIWETNVDKFNPRTNILTGTFSFKKRMQRHKNPIWASMSYNVGNYGARTTRSAWKEKGEHWYCIKIKNSIRRGRQFTYSYKFAKKSGRIRQWEKLFGDIPKDVMKEFWNGKGDSYCKSTIHED